MSEKLGLGHADMVTGCTKHSNWDPFGEALREPELAS